MNRKHLHHALLLAAATLLASGAYAQSPSASPQGKGHAADPADKAGEKSDKGKDKDKADKGKDKDKDALKDGKEGADPAKVAEDRAARKAKEHDSLREKLKTKLKGPIDAAMKQELRRHAERLARLERIKTVATGEKDTDTVEKATKLVAKENERHEKWIEKHVATPAPTEKGAAQ